MIITQEILAFKRTKSLKRYIGKIIELLEEKKIILFVWYKNMKKNL